MSRKFGDKLLQMYLYLTKEQESPTRFHKWVFVSCIFQMLGRKCWVDRNLYTLYPNEYILLVGGSGKVKKDTAIDLGTEMLENCCNPPTLFKGGISGSKMLGVLSEMSDRVNEKGNNLDSTISLIAPEFASFIGTHPQNQDMLNYLTGLYKSPDNFPYATRAHGHEALRNVCINILGGSTVDWLQDSIPISSVAGGFTARLVMIYAKKPRKRKTWPEKAPYHDDIMNSIIRDIEEIGCLEGEFKVTEDARDQLNEWYQHVNYEDDDPMGPFLERRLDHTIKLAMALSAVESNKMVIDREHTSQATRWILDLLPGMRLIHEEFEKTESGVQIDRVLARIKSAKAITRSDLLQSVSRYMKAKGLDEVLATLLQTHVSLKRTGTGARMYIYDPPERRG